MRGNIKISKKQRSNLGRFFVEERELQKWYIRIRTSEMDKEIPSILLDALFQFLEQKQKDIDLKYADVLASFNCVFYLEKTILNEIIRGFKESDNEKNLTKLINTFNTEINNKTDSINRILEDSYKDDLEDFYENVYSLYENIEEYSLKLELDQLGKFFDGVQLKDNNFLINLNWTDRIKILKAELPKLDLILIEDRFHFENLLKIICTVEIITEAKKALILDFFSDKEIIDSYLNAGSILDDFLVKYFPKYLFEKLKWYPSTDLILFKYYEKFSNNEILNNFLEKEIIQTLKKIKI